MTWVVMEIEILATESLGVRSMATLIRMPGRTILIDPGVALGTIRYGLAPSRTTCRHITSELLPF